MIGKVKKVFPGSNTSVGFYSYYEYIIEKDANRIFVLKGGPGTGKSSLMNRVSEEMINRGFDIEIHHCSSDNEGIDAIVIPRLRVGMVDGTSPHIVDPKVPGAVDEIINLGEFWNAEKMELRKEEIIKSMETNSIYYRRAYRYLGAAGKIIDDIIEKNSMAMNFSKVNHESYQLLIEIFKDTFIEGKVGKMRHLFGSAYTPTGRVEYTDTILSGINKVYYIKGELGSGKSTLLDKISKEAVSRGLDIEIYHTPLIPEKIETVVINKLNVGLTTSEMFNNNYYSRIDLDKYLDNEVINKYRLQIEEDKRVSSNLINKGIADIAEAKKNHDVIENYYVPNMNFDDMEELRNNIVERIFRYDK